MSRSHPILRLLLITILRDRGPVFAHESDVRTTRRQKAEHALKISVLQSPASVALLHAETQHRHCVRHHAQRSDECHTIWRRHSPDAQPSNALLVRFDPPRQRVSLAGDISNRLQPRLDLLLDGIILRTPREALSNSLTLHQCTPHYTLTSFFSSGISSFSAISLARCPLNSPSNPLNSPRVLANIALDWSARHWSAAEKEG